MRLHLTAVDASGGAEAERLDVVVSLEPGDAVAVLEAALTQALPPATGTARPPGVWRAGRQLDPRARVAAAGIRDGDVLALGGPRGSLVEDAAVGGVAEVRVIGGPDAGLVARLPYGDASIGRVPGAAVLLTDDDVSRRHAVLSVTPQALTLSDGGSTGPSTNGTRIEEVPISAPTPLLAGQVFRIGEDLLTVSVPQQPDGDVTPAGDGTWDYNRPPRIQPATRPPTVELPKEPGTPDKRPFPLMAMVAPIGMGLGLFALTKSPTSLLFVLMSPLMIIGNLVSERRGGKKSHGTKMREYEAAKAMSDHRLARLLHEETVSRRSADPDPAEVLLTATGPRRRLWERRRTDDDALVLRVGLADAEARVKVKPAGGGGFTDDLPPQVVRQVPVLVGLRDVGVLGVTGPRPRTRAIARWLVGQLAVLHSPRDLSMVLLVDGPSTRESRHAWEWIRWLPHLAPTEGVDALAAVGAEPESVARRVTELAALVTARVRASQDVRGRLSLSGQTSVVVVLDGIRALRALPGMPQVLAEGPAVGVYAICLDTDERLLPEEARAVVACEPEPSRVTVRRAGGDTTEDVRADAVSPAWGERVARAMSPLRDVSIEEGASQIPTAARLLDVMALDPPTGEGVLARWTLGGRSTGAVIGVNGDGPFTLDLRRDGPHALVAGTTGAGKSEFLQTLVASLAVANRPDAMTFVLVDYKGGAAFKDCARLPHTVGMVTDLDGHLVERALASLSAELKTREHLLGQAGAKDIEDYWQDGAKLGALPRLCIVIDEFASMVEELPDFVRGLVGIAQRGRSLGVHLVLATQRPGGVVSPEIRANTNLRIALRVTDSAESSDVIDAPDAAQIAKSTPGRGYARTGASSLLAFQSARVGGRRPGLVTAADAEITVTEVEWERVGLPLPRSATTEAPEDDQTDLHALVEAVRDAHDTLGLPPQRSPWLPALPDILPLSTLEPADARRPGELRPVVFGLEDLPAEQARRSAVLDLEHGSHLMFSGAPRSGRSTALRTVAGSIAASCDPGDVHIYALDCGNGALLPLAGLPHCGAVVTRTQIDRADRLLTRLTAEVARRQELLAERGFADIAEQRAASAADDRLPYLVLLVDRWEGFMGSFDEVDTGRLTDTFLRLLREGPGAGLRVVVAGDRSTLLGKLASTIEDKLCLRLADRADFNLAALNARKLPDVIEPGRAFRAETAIEVQLALLGDDPAGPAQSAEITALVEKWADQPALPRERRPFRVEVMPARITSEEADALQALNGEPRPVSPLWAVVGVGGDELTPYAVDLDLTGPAFVIGGPPRSGRSTTLVSMAHSFLAGGGTSLVLLSPRPSPLRDLAQLPGVVGLVTSSDPNPGELAEVLNAVEGPMVMLIDDAELLHPSEVQPLLQQVLRDGRDMTHALVMAGTTEELMAAFRGFTADARKSRNGLILSPETHLQGELLGLRLPRSSVFNGPTGRGILSTGGVTTLVQVPLPPGM